MPKAHKKVLIARFGAIGDLFNITAIIRAIKQQKGYEIHVVTKSQYGLVFKDNPHLDKLILLDQSWSKLVTALRAERYDYLIDLHANLRSYRLAVALNVETFRLEKYRLRRWLYLSSKVDLLPKTHLVEEFFKAIEPMGVHYDGHGTDFFAATENSTLNLSDYICLNISGSRFTKRIPVGLAINIIKAIEKPVVLVGGKDVDREAQQICTATDAINKVGQASLAETAAIIKSSIALITGDTGIMHMGAALKHPMVVLWGPTDPIFGLYGLYPNGLEHRRNDLVLDNVACHPCSPIGYHNCPAGDHRCMDFSVNLVISSINNLILAN